jgi:hypothetical protein
VWVFLGNHIFRVHIAVNINTLPGNCVYPDSHPGRRDRALCNTSRRIQTHFPVNITQTPRVPGNKRYPGNWIPLIPLDYTVYTLLQLMVIFKDTVKIKRCPYWLEGGNGCSVSQAIDCHGSIPAIGMHI